MSDNKLIRADRKRGPEDGTRGPLSGQGGAPRKELDPAAALRLAMIQCTDKEIAHCLDVNEGTLIRRKQDDPVFAETLERARSQGRMSLRRVQWQSAQAGNATMQIWLGKQILGQRDRFEHSGDPEAPTNMALHMLAARAISDHLARTRPDVPTASTIEGTPVAGSNLLDAPQPTE